jgi:glycosyltransferase involved in cell wall biosynthesis
MDLAWVEEFRRAKGRPLRILHLGNVANNAYYLARSLDRLGVHADVCASPYYHIMSSPEWEEAEFDQAPRDHYFPDWWNLDLGAYARPRWFASGPWDLCIAYLRARVLGHDARADALWSQLERARMAAHTPHRRRWLRGRIPAIVPQPVLSHVKRFLRPLIGRRIRYRSEATRAAPPDTPVAGDRRSLPAPRTAESLLAEFVRRFPERGDRLTLDDLAPYRTLAESLGPLFACYDVVHAYGADVVYPALAGTRPYVALEHGTLRDAPDSSWPYKGPFYANALGRLTALGYALADHVFVTNADTLESVRRLGIARFSPIGHPFDDSPADPDDDRWKEIRARVGADHLLLCPIRHDWQEKGTDTYIRALPGLRRALGNRFKVCFMPWGKEVSRSRRLIRDLGCEDLVEWVGPFGRVWFTRWIAAADVVYDQLAYASFSGTTPRALVGGVPVLVRYDPRASSGMFDEPPPVLPADSVETVIEQTLKAIDPVFRREYHARARDWVARHHSQDRLVGEVLRVYRRLLPGGEPDADTRRA